MQLSGTVRTPTVDSVSIFEVRRATLGERSNFGAVSHTELTTTIHYRNGEPTFLEATTRPVVRERPGEYVPHIGHRTTLLADALSGQRRTIGISQPAVRDALLGVGNSAQGVVEAVTPDYTASRFAEDATARFQRSPSKSSEVLIEIATSGDNLRRQYAARVDSPAVSGLMSDLASVKRGLRWEDNLGTLYVDRFAVDIAEVVRPTKSMSVARHLMWNSALVARDAAVVGGCVATLAGIAYLAIRGNAE